MILSCVLRASSITLRATEIHVSKMRVLIESGRGSHELIASGTSANVELSNDSRASTFATCSRLSAEGSEIIVD